MTLRIAINGFGRMGRLFLRAAWQNTNLEIVHINEPACDSETSAHLLEFDSVHGRFQQNIRTEENIIIINDKKISYSQASAPDGVDWKKLGIDLLIEASGKYRTSEKLAPFFQMGVPKILVACPVKSNDALNLVFGVNHTLYDPSRHHIITAASCTTNCIAPAIKVIHENLGIERGSITTIHDVTNTQVMVDAPHKDLRRARSGLTSLIPTSTGSAKAITMIYPELTGKLNGHAVRVPLLNASLTDCVFELKRKTTEIEVNALFHQAADGELHGILGIEDRPLVSCDFTNDARSTIVDGPSTMVVDGTHLKLYLWYDNEWGYVCRMNDIADMIAKKS